MSHFSSIGVPASSSEELVRTLESLHPHAVDDGPVGAAGRHLRWTDESGAAIALHLGEGGMVDCVTPYFVAPSPARWRVRTTGPQDDPGCAHCGGADCDILDSGGEMVTRATVQWLHFQPWRAWLSEPREFDLEVVAFAHHAAFFTDPAGFDEGQASFWGPTEPGEEPLRLAQCAFLPEGMFGEGGDVGARATCILTGRVESVAALTNAACGRAFTHARIVTVPGPVDVVFDQHEGTPEVGAIALVQAWLVGRPEGAPPGALRAVSLS